MRWDTVAIMMAAAALLAWVAYQDGLTDREAIQRGLCKVWGAYQPCPNRP